MKDNPLLGIFAWIVGAIVALVVGSGMIEKTLTVPGIPEIITFIAGWAVISATIIGTILAVFTK